VVTPTPINDGNNNNNNKSKNNNNGNNLAFVSSCHFRTGGVVKDEGLIGTGTATGTATA